MNRIWILFSIANDGRARKKLFWFEPTTEELGELLCCSQESMLPLLEGQTVIDDGTRYWIKPFTQ